MALKRIELLFLRLPPKKSKPGVPTDTLIQKLHQRTLDLTCETFPDHPFWVTASCSSCPGFYVSYCCSLEPLPVSGPQHFVDASPALTQHPLGQFSETPALALCTARIHPWSPAASSSSFQTKRPAKGDGHYARESVLPPARSWPTGEQQETLAQTFYRMFPFHSTEVSLHYARLAKSPWPISCPYRTPLGLARKLKPNWPSMSTLVY